MKIFNKCNYWRKRLYESFFFSLIYKQNKTDSTERLLIFGNGPSLNKIITFISQNDIRSKFALLCVNDFATNANFFELKPSLYYLLDPGYFSFDLNENTSAQIEINYKIISAFNNCNWEMSLFIPFISRDGYLEKSINNPYVSINYYSTVHYPSFFNNNFFYSIKFSNPPFQNILNAALFSSMQKFKYVYLCGADFSFHEDLFIDDNNNLLKRNSHFYSNNNEHTPILKLGNGNGKFSIGEYFQAISIMFKTFELIKDFSIYINVHIINLSETSFIDCFDRKKIEEIEF